MHELKYSYGGESLRTALGLPLLRGEWELDDKSKAHYQCALWNSKQTNKNLKTLYFKHQAAFYKSTKSRLYQIFCMTMKCHRNLAIIQQDSYWGFFFK